MPPKGSDLIFDHRHDAADRVLLDCRGAGILVRRAHRTGPVTPTVKLGAGHGAGVSRSAGRDALMPPRLEDGLRDGWAVGRVPRDRGRSGGRTPARAHPASGLRLAAGPRNVGAAARRVHTLPAVTLSDTGGQGERTRSRRSERPGLLRRSPAETLRSRPFCTHTPRLWRPQASTAGGLSHGLTAAYLEPSVKTGCCTGPLPPGAAEEPEGVCLGSRIGRPCGNLHRAGLTGRPLAGVPSGLRCSRMRFGIWRSPVATREDPS